MKLHKNLLFGIIASVLCLCDASANATQPCPAGCFCLKDGKYNTPPRALDCENQHSHLIDPSTFNTRTYDTVQITGYRDSGITADWYVEDFSELYESPYGLYGFKKDGEFITIRSYILYNDDVQFYDYVFTCPVSHPLSEEGSDALRDCFKYDENGNKIYYGSTNYENCNTDAIRTNIKNLQQALLDAAQDLQDALDKANTNTSAQKNPSKTEKSNKNYSDEKESNTNSKLEELKKQISSNMITPIKKASDKTMQNKNINSKSAVRF